jgi:hypothetical protein
LAFQTSILVAQSIYCLTKINISEDASYFGINILLTLLGILGFAFVSVLLAFHLFLMYQNTTTNEFCKKVWEKMSGNPFAK